MLNLLMGLGIGCALAPLYKLYRKSKSASGTASPQVIHSGTPAPFITIAPKLIIITKIDVPVRSRNGRDDAHKPSQLDFKKSAERVERKPSEDVKDAVAEMADADSPANESTREPVKLSASMPVRDNNHVVR